MPMFDSMVEKHSWLSERIWRKDPLYSYKEVIEDFFPPIMRCEKCGGSAGEVGDLTGKFCPSCGHRHPGCMERQERMHRPRCPHCHAERQIGAYCTECGKKIKKKKE